MRTTFWTTSFFSFLFFLCHCWIRMWWPLLCDSNQQVEDERSRNMGTAWVFEDYQANNTIQDNWSAEFFLCKRISNISCLSLYYSVSLSLTWKQPSLQGVTIIYQSLCSQSSFLTIQMTIVQCTEAQSKKIQLFAIPKAPSGGNNIKVIVFSMFTQQILSICYVPETIQRSKDTAAEN